MLFSSLTQRFFGSPPFFPWIRSFAERGLPARFGRQKEHMKGGKKGGHRFKVHGRKMRQNLESEAKDGLQRFIRATFGTAITRNGRIGLV